jgi:hypothetical protein
MRAGRRTVPQYAARVRRGPAWPRSRLPDRSAPPPAQRLVRRACQRTSRVHVETAAAAAAATEGGFVNDGWNRAGMKEGSRE